MEQYFKAYPVCRWAQPAIEAALTLQRAHGLMAEWIDRVEVVTFHEGTRLSTRRPVSSDEAQYSLPFAVAAALVRGQVGAAEVSGAALRDAAILRVSEAVMLTEDDGYNAKFPAERWAHVVFHMPDGSVLRSAPMEARGGELNPLSDDDLREKYWRLAEPVLGTARTQQIETCVMAERALAELRELVLSPVKD
jgi:2-methylcitrate dehydratase PrpD